MDCYTVEPSGLGVPPYLSTYVRDAFCALRRAYPEAPVRYLRIDDVRWCLNGGASLCAKHCSKCESERQPRGPRVADEGIAPADLPDVLHGFSLVHPFPWMTSGRASDLRA